jgi:hypothetical protein
MPTFWRRSVKPVFYKNPLYIFVWLMLLASFSSFYVRLLSHRLLRVIYAADFYSFYLGISRLSYALISLLWAVSALPAVDL